MLQDQAVRIAAGFAALTVMSIAARLAFGGRKSPAPRDEEDELTILSEKECTGSKFSTRPPSQLSSPSSLVAGGSPAPQQSEGDMLFFTILESYNSSRNISPELSSGRSSPDGITAGPASGKKKRRSRRRPSKHVGAVPANNYHN